MRRSFFLAALSLLLLTSPSFAQVQLKHKMANGAKKTIQTITKTEQELILAGMNIETKSEQIIVLESINGVRGEDGKIEVVTTTKSMIVDLNLPGGVQLKFDSANPEAGGGGTQFDVFLDLFKVLSKNTWTTTHDKDNRAVEIEGQKEVLEKLDGSLKTLVEGQLSGEYLLKMTNIGLDRIPSKAIKVGDTWKQDAEVRLEGGQLMELTSEFKYVGTVDSGSDKLDKIEYKVTKASFDSAPDAQVKYIKSDIKVVSSKGTILFDRKSGSVVKDDLSFNLVGDLIIEVANQKLDGKVDLKMETHTELLK